MNSRTAALLAALTMLLAGCGGGSGGGSGGGTQLVMSRVKDAINLDPSHAVDGMSYLVDQEILEGLVTFKPGSFDIAPGLAQTWSSDAKGTTWTFDLRPGAKFSDGTAADAEAVKFNFDRWRLTTNPFHGAYSYSYYADVFGGFPGRIADVKVASPTRVVFTLDRPLGSFLRDLAMPAFLIGSPAAIRQDPGGFERKPIGDGPYTLVEWVKDDHITLAANPSYDGVLPKAKFQNVIIRDIPDQATSVLSLQKGDIDILTDPRPDDAKAMASQSGVSVVGQPSNNLSYLAMNVEKKPFGDVRVRQAVAYAIDVEAMANGLYGKGATAADDWLPPKMLGEDPSLKHYPHDVAKAKSLLAAAGFPNGFSTTLYYPTTPRPYMPEPQRIAETLQANLREAGIQITLQPYEFGVFLSKVKNGEHDICLIGWTGDNGDPDNFLYPLLDEDSAHKGTAQNYSFWRDPAFHRLMLAGEATTNDAARAPIYRKAQAMVHDLVPAIPLVHTAPPIALKSALSGFVPSPDLQYHLELISPGAK